MKNTGGESTGACTSGLASADGRAIDGGILQFVRLRGMLVRGITVRDAVLASAVCVATVLTLHFIGEENYLLGLPTVLTVLISLCLVRRESVPAWFILVPAIILSALVYTLVAAGISFPGAFMLGLVLGGCSAALWFLHRHISAVSQA